MPDEPLEAPSNDADRVLEECPQCSALMDVTDFTPLSEVACPTCGAQVCVRQIFNHFQLLSVLGEGGMGSVFKALDQNLNRHVALKILKKECSSTESDWVQLADEARMTAAVNHPNVVKVYDFGQDGGEFYIAMELVEKGSLDHLMSIQKRIPEAQVLEVGIQIARGLEAALEMGLIHRDIKPGNILFADAHTAKLVDFGLAIVMDAEAQSKGEIWGTPYYIAPEKLDNQPEDFRSDIYSLGGTLFHALAGRPPYEADTPSMVALKQLKSQPVSLQTFAPDVTSETAYVINRMMAKDPAQRYQSYEELAGHLHYAREKLLERASRPVKEKERVVLESAETRKWTAIISLGLLITACAVGISTYFAWGRLFPGSPEDKSAPIVRRAAEELNDGAKMVVKGAVENARGVFRKVAADDSVAPEQQNWALLNLVLCDALEGKKQAARETANGVKDIAALPGGAKDKADFFIEVSRVIRTRDTIGPGSVLLYSTPGDAFALLLFGAWNWEVQRAPSDAAPFLGAFVTSQPSAEWVAAYLPLAQKYMDDFKLLQPLYSAVRPVNSVENAKQVLSRIPEIRSRLKTGKVAEDALDQLEKQLRVKVGA